MEGHTGSTVALTEAELPTCVLRVSRNDTTLTKSTRCRDKASVRPSKSWYPKPLALNTSRVTDSSTKFEHANRRRLPKSVYDTFTVTPAQASRNSSKSLRLAYRHSGSCPLEQSHNHDNGDSQRRVASEYKVRRLPCKARYQIRD